MSDNVVNIGVSTTLDLPSERILGGAREREITDIVLLGYDKDGEFYMACAPADLRDMLVLVELAKRQIMDSLTSPSATP